MSSGEGPTRVFEMSPDTTLSELPGFLIVLAFVTGALVAVADALASACALIYLADAGIRGVRSRT